MTRIAVFSILIFFSASVTADQATLNQCQSWSKKKAMYEDARRKGGSSSQMKHWKKQINRYKDLMMRGNCIRHGSKLK